MVLLATLLGIIENGMLEILHYLFSVFGGRNKVTKAWKGAQILPEMSFLAELCVLLKLMRRSVKTAA